MRPVLLQYAYKSVKGSALKPSGKLHVVTNWFAPPAFEGSLLISPRHGLPHCHPCWNYTWGSRLGVIYSRYATVSEGIIHVWNWAIYVEVEYKNLFLRIHVIEAF
jgi:hypothetical protein